MSQTFIESHQAQQLMAAWRRAYGEGRPLTRVHEPAPPRAATSRGEGDAQAAWQRWHVSGVDARFTAAEWPWYVLLEQARVETLASRHLPGMARNLSRPEMLSPTDPAMARLYQAARHIFAGQTDPGASVVKLAGEAPASAHGREFLENHLRAVIARIEASPIQLVAIGTGQDVGRFYRQAVTVRRPEAVAEVLFERLGDLLTQPDAVEKF